MSFSVLSTTLLSRASTSLPVQRVQTTPLLRQALRSHVRRPLHQGFIARHASQNKRPSVPEFTKPGEAVKPMLPSNSPSAPQAGRKFAPLFLSALAAAMGLYIAQLVVIANQPCKHPGIDQLANQQDVAARYDETADSFDSDVGLSEALMGVNSIRRDISRQCRGHVLEVSCGTGRNLGYYDLSPSSAIDSLTSIDLSAPMVDACKRKWRSLYPPSATPNWKPNLSVRFATCSALSPMPLSPSGTKYTTIVQTMGICSTPTPHELLVNMAQHLDTSDPDARILLLEHGRSYYGWLNRILDASAQKHAEIHGCWFNRDVGAIVAEAAEVGGLEVVTEYRAHLGTTSVFELKPSKKAVEAAAAAGSAKAEPKAQETEAPTQKQGQTPATADSSGWRGWLGLK